VRTTPRPARAPHASARDIAEVAGGQLAFVDGPAGPAGPDAAEAADADVTLSGVTLDSRLVVPGDLYAALPGSNAHGASFGTGAAAAGAAAVLTDPAGADLLRAAGVRLPRIVVPDPRGVLGAVSAALYGRPADDMVLVGITGTNGKTTTAYLLEAALRVPSVGEHRPDRHHRDPDRVRNGHGRPSGRPRSRRELHALFAPCGSAT
jgi:UDP-N-acetylmuramoyl-L-alanyl-D-glutamate--2,6-diaminopimelate ligase